MSSKRRVKNDTQRKQGACGGNQCPDIKPPVISSCIHHSAYTTQRLQDRSHTHWHLTFILKLLKIVVKKKKKKKKKIWYSLLQESYKNWSSLSQHINGITPYHRNLLLHTRSTLFWHPLLHFPDLVDAWNTLKKKPNMFLIRITLNWIAFTTSVHLHSALAYHHLLIRLERPPNGVTQ